MAQAHRYNKKHLQFFIVDNCIEIYARYMILLGLAKEPIDITSLQEKTELFLEIFGNSLVRENTFDYIANKANDFIRLVTDFSYLEEKMPFINLNSLKYKELDGLEALFKLWRNRNPEAFKISNCWDFRLRQYLNTRYDAHRGVFDWDYNMKLKDKGADMIHILEYIKWRKTGIAFEIRDAEYTLPNNTLSSVLVIKHQGERYLRRGYWGDIVTGPYIAFGIECENKEFLKKRNEMYIKTSQEISYQNILIMLHELTYNEYYKISNESKEINQKEKIIELKPNEEIEKDQKQFNNNEFNENSIDYNIEHCKNNLQNMEINEFKECENSFREKGTVTFLPVNSIYAMINKSKYHHFFDIIYLSNSSTSYFTSEFQEVFADNAVIIIETIKFILNINKELTNAFSEKLKSLIEEIKNCKLIGTFDVEINAYIQLLYSRSNT